VNRGEVWWVERPELGRRPHLVLTRQAAIPVLNALLAVPATHMVRGIPTEVELGPDDGMPAACALSLDNLTLVPKAMFVERICRLGPDRMSGVCRALALASGCA
jgi:mRNA interferase MazF